MYSSLTGSLRRTSFISDSGSQSQGFLLESRKPRVLSTENVQILGKYFELHPRVILIPPFDHCQEPRVQKSTDCWTVIEKSLRQMISEQLEGRLFKICAFTAEKTFPGTLRNWRWECRLEHSFWKKIWQYVLYLGEPMPYDQATSLWSLHPRETQALAYKGMCIRVFMVALVWG